MAALLTELAKLKTSSDPNVQKLAVQAQAVIDSKGAEKISSCWSQ